MLTLTENARTILTSLTTQPGAEEITALRISADESQSSLVASPAKAPEAQDQVVEDGEATVFLDAAAAVQLDDKVLDAGLDQDGNVQFALAPQGAQDEAGSA